MNTAILAALLLTTISGTPVMAADPNPAEGTAPKTDQPPGLVRQRFVPGSAPARGASDYKGASQTDLGPGPVKGVLWCQAHADVGDEFPVIDKKGVTLFKVRLAEGDDDRLALEISSKEGLKKLLVIRDKRAAVTIGGIEYELLYPSVSVAAAPGEKPTTNKAMLMVTRRL